MQDIDITAEKLKGNNCFVKFKDGEILFLKITGIDNDDDYLADWLMQVEDFINGRGDSFDTKNFPGGEVALSAKEIKYVRVI